MNHRVPRIGRALLTTAVLVATAAGCGPSSGSVVPSAAPSAATALPPSPTPRRTVTPAPTLPPGVALVATLEFRPSGIVVDGDVLWAEDHAKTNAFYAINPQTGGVLTKIAARRPCDLVAAYDRIWLVDLDAGTLMSVDPDTMKIVDTIGGKFEMACGPQAAGGAIWFAANPGFARVDVKTRKFAITATGDGTFPAPGVTPSGNSIWGVIYGTAQLVKINIATGKVQLKIPPPGQSSEEEPVAVAFGSLWVGNAAVNKVFRLDPETGAIRAEIMTTAPSRFVATTEGLWYSSYLKGTVQRIDPTTNKVVFSVHLGGNINGIAAGAGAIWAGDTRSGKLYRIDLAANGILD